MASLASAYYVVAAEARSYPAAPAVLHVSAWPFSSPRKQPKDARICTVSFSVMTFALVSRLHAPGLESQNARTLEHISSDIEQLMRLTSRDDMYPNGIQPMCARRLNYAGTSRKLQYTAWYARPVWAERVAWLYLVALQYDVAAVAIEARR